MADMNPWVRTQQVAALAEHAIDILELRRQSWYSTQHDKGQRRMATRILAKLNDRIVALGGTPVDEGDGYSEDGIDEGLRA